MLTLRLVAVLGGMGAGTLTAAIVGLVAWPLLSVLGLEGAPLAAVTAGTLAGLGVAGWVAGRLARFSQPFHGAVAGLALAGLVVLISRLGGSPASTPTVLLLAALALLLGGGGGTLAGRKSGT